MNGILIVLQFVGLSDVIGSCSAPGPVLAPCGTRILRPAGSSGRGRKSSAGVKPSCSVRSLQLPVVRSLRALTHSQHAPARCSHTPPPHPTTTHNDYLRAAAVLSLHPHLCSLIKEEKIFSNFFISTHKVLQHSVSVHLELLKKTTKLCFPLMNLFLIFFYELPFILPLARAH